MLMKPNFVTDRNEFYISYNDRDTNIYGSDTTALVFGQMERFYILNGDHRKEYSTLKDFNACFEYFKQNSQNINKFSEQPSN